VTRVGSTTNIMWGMLMMRKASSSKKNKVNLTDILKWYAINEKEKAKLQEVVVWGK
jgi:hypothetical protein